MMFEGQEPPGDEMEIRECEPPRRLAVTSQVGEERWDLDGDLAAIDFERDYYPVMAAHYREQRDAATA